jgi:hypothetical protein
VPCIHDKDVLLDMPWRVDSVLVPLRPQPGLRGAACSPSLQECPASVHAHDSSLQALKRASQLGLSHPRDRKGKSVEEKSIYSSEALEEALEDYRAVCLDAKAAVREQLRRLAEQLEVRLGGIV